MRAVIGKRGRKMRGAAATAGSTDYVICRFDAAVPDPDVVQSYVVNGARVYVTRDGLYLVREPPLTVRAERA